MIPQYIHNAEKKTYEQGGKPVHVLEIERHFGGNKVSGYRMPFPSLYPDRSAYVQLYGWLETDGGHQRQGHGEAIFNAVGRILQNFANEKKIPVKWKPAANDKSVGLMEKLNFEPVDKRGPGEFYQKTFKPGKNVELSEVEKKALRVLLENAEECQT